jgi:hypothetical protein
VEGAEKGGGIDARRGTHGNYFDGYLLDALVDADSEIITALEVLPGNGDEGADSEHLPRQEEEAQGNDVAALSTDGILSTRGEVVRRLEELIRVGFCRVGRLPANKSPG